MGRCASITALLWWARARVAPGKLFAVVPDTEHERLRSMSRGINSVEDALRVLAPLCSDDVITFLEGYFWPVERGANTPVRALTFIRLSEVADVQVSVNDDKSIQVTLGLKYIGPLKTGSNHPVNTDARTSTALCKGR